MKLFHTHSAKPKRRRKTREGLDWGLLALHIGDATAMADKVKGVPKALRALNNHPASANSWPRKP